MYNEARPIYGMDPIDKTCTVSQKGSFITPMKVLY